MARIMRNMLIPNRYLCVFSPFLLLFLLLVYNEFLVYFVVLWSCSWPILENGTNKLHLMMLADPHLLGEKRGHWFDKLRREWQMYRAFQTAQTLFAPDIVFVLGDLFDEGDIATSSQFNGYVRRFESVFYVDPTKTQLYTTVGNHDVGFHYAMRPSRLSRFDSAFRKDVSSPVQLLQLRNNSTLVLLNSMAMENDGCQLCERAHVDVRHIGDALQCTSNSSDACAQLRTKFRLHSFTYPRPILLQHFPLYRRSEAECNEPDGAPDDEKDQPMREKWECLSAESTRYLLDTLLPRAAFDGHSHYGCRTTRQTSSSLHTFSFVEWTLSSFSWRNNVRPAFLLTTVTADELKVSRCGMPTETTVLRVYLFGSVVVCVLFIVALSRACCRHKMKYPYVKLFPV